MGLISTIIFIAIVYFAFKAIRKKFLGGLGFPNFKELAKLSQDEKIGFQNLMMTPNDDTVSAYIDILKRLADFSTKNSASQDMTTGMQMKYSNAYKFIKKCDTVSPELKKELGRMFMVMGVAVSID